MRIIFDFDYTLFDSDKLKKAIKEIFVRHGVSDKLFERTREESKNGERDWKPNIQFKLLVQNSMPQESIEFIRTEFYKLLKSTQGFLYSDTLPFLKRMYKNHQLALLSYGEDSFQNSKVDGCRNFKKYFEKIIITKNIYKDKEASELAGGDRAIFVEDNPVALSAAKKFAPQIITIRMKRGMGRHDDEISGKGVDYTVKNLHEIEKIMLNV